MKKFYFVLISLTIMGFVLGYLIFPNSKDSALMDFQSNNYYSAIKKYEDYIKRTNDVSPNVIVPLSNLYLIVGDTDKAIVLIQHYILENPDSVEAKILLKDYFKSTQSVAELIKISEELALISPKSKNYRTLFQLYSSKGYKTKVAETLNMLIRADDYKINEPDFQLLIYYYASENKLEEAEKIADILINKKKYKIKQFETYNLIVSILINNSKTEKAYKIARLAMAKKFKTEEKIIIADKFIYRTPDKAEKLLQRIRRYNGNSKKLILAVFNLKIQTENSEMVLTELRKMFTTGKMDKVMLNFYLSLLLETKKQHEVKVVIRKCLASNLTDENLFLTSTFLLINNDKKTAELLKSKIPADDLNLYPELKFVLNSAIEGKSLSETAKVIFDKKYYLSDKQILQIVEALWLEGKSKLCEKFLSRMPIKIICLEFDLELFAKIALESGKIDNYINDLSLYLDSYNTNKILQIPQAYLIMLIASDNIEKFNSTLNGYKNDVNYRHLLESSLFASLNFGRGRIALETSQKLYSIDKSIESRLYLAEAYILNKMYSEANKLFSTIEIKNKKSAVLYLRILTQLASENGKETVITLKSKYKNAIKIILNKNPSKENLRVVAYFYTSIGNLPEAVDIFFKLAKREEKWTSDTKELVNLVSQNNNKKVQLWLKQKASTVEFPEKNNWLRGLIKSGGSKDVLKIVKRIEDKFNVDSCKLKFLSQNYTAGYANYLSRIKPEKYDLLEPDILLKALYNVSEYESFINEMQNVKIKEYLKSPEKTKCELFIIFTEAGFYRKALVLLKEINKKSLFLNVEPLIASEAFIGGKQIDRGIKYFESYETNNPNLKNRLSRALLIMYAAGDFMKPILKWLEATKNPDKTLVNDLFYSALKNKNNSTALLIAKNVYDKKKTEVNRGLYIEALYVNRHYNKVLNLIAYPKNNIERSIYLASISGLYKTTKKLPAHYTQALDKIYTEATSQNTRISNKEKRSLGYILVDIGKKEKAKEIFFSLAQNKSVRSPDVEQLMYLIGKKTNLQEQKWIENRAEKSSGMNMVNWCKYLNQTSNPESTIRIIEENVFAKSK